MKNSIFTIDELNDLQFGLLCILETFDNIENKYGGKDPYYTARRKEIKALQEKLDGMRTAQND